MGVGGAADPLGVGGPQMWSGEAEDHGLRETGRPEGVADTREGGASGGCGVGEDDDDGV